jgi:hypothetical protein
MASPAAPPAAQAHRRQRGDGGDPVGVSSRTNWRQAKAIRMLTLW